MARASNPSSGRSRKQRVARASGRTIEIALSRALAELDYAPGELDDEQFEYTVIIPPEEGYLGVGGVDAVVEVELLLDDEVFVHDELGPPREEPEDEYDEEEPEDWEEVQPQAGSARLRAFLDEILRAFGLSAKVRIVEQVDLISAEISGEDLGVLIGKRGQTIDAIEYLASIVLYPRPDSRKRVEIDAEGYKERRRIAIERVAVRKAQEAAKRGRPVELEPMTAAERKIVHVALKDRRDVVTESRGREPHRAVVITPTR